MTVLSETVRCGVVVKKKGSLRPKGVNGLKTKILGLGGTVSL
jgi:hypothetical protein